MSRQEANTEACIVCEGAGGTALNDSGTDFEDFSLGHGKMKIKPRGTERFNEFPRGALEKSI
jgi:hypothetical protein